MDINWILFSVTTAVYVLYVSLCSVAIWSTFQDSWSSRIWMRASLIVMLLLLTTVFVLKAIQCHLNTENYSSSINLRLDILQVVLNVATCLAGVLSDGLLAWRCFVMYGKQSWMKWLLAALIALDFGIGTLSNIALTAQLRVDEDAFISSDQARLTAEGNAILAQKLLDVWAWCFFAVNTTMTMSIIYKIFSSANSAKILRRPCEDRNIYSTVIRAIIESSFITWIGLLACATASTYELANFKLLGSNSTDVGNASVVYTFVLTLLPFMFGISQTLITARIGFSLLRTSASASKETSLVFLSNHRAIEGAEPTSSVFDTTKGGGEIEMCTTRSSTPSGSS